MLSQTTSQSTFKKSSQFVALAVLTAVLLTSCKSPKKTETDTGAQGSQGNAAQSTDLPPVVSDKALSADAQGSDSGKIPGLFTVYFAYDKASLSAEARKKLAENADWIKNNPKVTIQIEGHTDSRGSIEYNLALGERRAKSVKSYLEGIGVDSKRMNVISYGKEKPLVTGDNEEAWSKNRRANFVPLQ
jgi:peptidoglycan-associated lipoprotein